MDYDRFCGFKAVVVETLKQLYPNWKDGATKELNAMWSAGGYTPHSEELAKFYKDAGLAYVKDLVRDYTKYDDYWNYSERLTRLLYFLESVGGENLTLLDFGCGIGIHDLVASRCGNVKLVYGVDINEASVKLASDLNVTLSERADISKACATKFFSDLDIVPDGTVNVIMAFDTMEHVPHPAVVFKSLLKKFVPGTVCYYIDNSAFTPDGSWFKNVQHSSPSDPETVEFESILKGFGLIQPFRFKSPRLFKVVV